MSRIKMSIITLLARVARSGLTTINSFNQVLASPGLPLTVFAQTDGKLVVEAKF